jgi:hypothetical protein
MQRIIRQSFPGGQLPIEKVSQESAWEADLIAQAYLKALRRAVPDEPETPVLWGIPLNLSERMLLIHIQELNEMLCQLARAERWHACEELWNQASKLVATFSELALKNPEPFKNKARLSLFMPSLRVPPTLRKSKKGKSKWIDPFLGDSPDISQAIELSAQTIGAKVTDNRTRLGALCARLVGECVHEIKRARGLWTRLYTPYGRSVAWPTQQDIQPFLGKNLNEVIASIRQPRRDGQNEDEIERHVRFFCLLSDCGSERLHFLLLPELTSKTAPTWWKSAIEKMVEARFPALLQQPCWEKELKAASRGTKADKRKELKDYCVGKVKQFASPSPCP